MLALLGMVDTARYVITGTMVGPNTEDVCRNLHDCPKIQRN
jgi:hypothetical protein